MTVPSSPASLCSPLAVRWYRWVWGKRTEAWGTAVQNPPLSSVSTASRTAPFDQPETATISDRSRKGIDARARSRSASHPAGLIPPPPLPRPRRPSPARPPDP